MGEQISYYGNGGYKYYVDVNGKIHTAVGPAVYSVSDERLKENIRAYDKGLVDILKLKPRLFDWKEGEGSNEKNVSGFVAQEFRPTRKNHIESLEEAIAICDV